MDLNEIKPPNPDKSTFIYLAVIMTLGAVSGIAALLGDENRAITPRAVLAYLFSGSIAAGAVVMLLSQSMGFSYVAIGVGILAGFKAIDVLSLGTTLIRKLLGLATTNEQRDDEKTRT